MKRTPKPLMRLGLYAGLGMAIVPWTGMAAHAQEAIPAPAPLDGALEARCRAMANLASGEVGKVDVAQVGADHLPPNQWVPVPTPLPRHCEILGTLQPREGRLGQHYAIHYHMRLPENWNGRFLLQGGAGSNGEVGDATGAAGFGTPSAINRGFAVISHDSGHDNRTNNDSKHGGAVVFGTDPIARANYGHAALPLVTRAGKALVRNYYRKAATHSYFYGCSKGGQEGMALAQRYPGLFDGIVAGAPGFSLPRAALNQAWSLQQFAALARKQTGAAPTASSIARSFSPSDLQLIRTSILNACDKADGLADGITGNIKACTAALVLPHLRALSCQGDKADSCLTSSQIDTFGRVMAGPMGRHGAPLYSRWAWDGGLGTPMWSMWRLGNERMPAMDITLGAPSLATVFTVPPHPVDDTLPSLLNYALLLSFPQAEGMIYARNPDFPRSAWQDIGMRSANLDGLRKNGGKLLVFHGAADPVFSLMDTVNWSDEVQARYGAQANDSVRMFAVPGMAHCLGGPATDEFDMLGAVVEWVEQGKAPAVIAAHAGPAAPWPERSRPLCAWPRYARFEHGDPEQMQSFRCALP